MLIAPVLMLLVSLVSTPRQWYPPSIPIQVTVRADQPVTLVLTDFVGKVLESRVDLTVDGERTINISEAFPQVRDPGAYILYEVPQGQTLPTFVGTPSIITVRKDRRRGAPTGPLVSRIEPLQYAAIETDHGSMSVGFYYDVAPHTVHTFLSLAQQGYFGGLTFHRIVPGFVIQGGDPKGDGTGGPGFTIPAEFSDRPHLPGVLSVARVGDPEEAPGVLPRQEFANSGSMQFFVCLDYAATKQLDGRYTTFGRVFSGMEAVNAIAASPVADKRLGTPAEPQVIRKITVHPVTSENNPYRSLLAVEAPATQPAME